jgi:hypothetical protein
VINLWIFPTWSLIFPTGRSIENTPIPLLPGDHPEVTSDKWMMAVRRGQEYKYEIIRKRARIAKNKRKEKTSQRSSW